ncbi:MAG: peptidylprolyl isomerase [Bacteroidaceae bacterium]|nr:peptidylprolyl isomerase [Bacteroidaceae bacterium]
MKKILLTIVVLLLGIGAEAKKEKKIEVQFETTVGDFRVELFNETPLHRDNFVKLVREGFYDSLLVHRAIYGFMVQMGDPTSRYAKPGESLGSGKVGYTVPAEIKFPEFFHQRGMLSMAREPDEVNPERASSGSQFFIVTGRVYMPHELKPIESKVAALTDGKVKYTDRVRTAYENYGGTPHLDGQYTVFGRVVEGMRNITSMQMVETDVNDRPVEDIRIIRATVIEPKK